MSRILVTGGAGFIGSHFVDSALAKGNTVLCIDNLSTGRKFFLEQAQINQNFQFVQADVTEFERLKSLFMDFKPDWTIHFSANADVRFGTNHPRKDLEQNTLATWNVLESCRLSGCSRLLFSSTGSVYGEPDVFPTPENCPFPTQTSLYGASKVAGEALISAYCYGYGLNAVVFRFVSILGPRYTHGHVFDFVRKLKADPDKLLILGNGAQLKSYLHVLDLMEGIWKVINSNPKSFNVFNIGHDEALNVTESARYIASRMNLTPEFSFTGGERGWIGDSPRIQLNTDKLKSLGWKTRFSLKESVEQTVDYLLQNSHLLGDA